MLKKAEYDEEISYRAIKSCLTLNPSALASSAAAGSSGGSSSSAGHNSSYHSTNHRSTDPAQRHKQGGSLQDLVEAAHRSELATTSAAAAAATAATTAATQRFNCDYQLSGRSNRRQQQHNQNATSTSASASKKIKNSSVSGRQREGGSLPSSVNFEPAAAMDAKQHKQQAHLSSEAAGGSGSASVGGNKPHHRSSTGSCSSLPSHLGERDPEAGIQFDMDEDEATGAGAGVGVSGIPPDYLLEVSDDTLKKWDLRMDGRLWEIARSIVIADLTDQAAVREARKSEPTALGWVSLTSVVLCSPVCPCRLIKLCVHPKITLINTQTFISIITFVLSKSRDFQKV